MLGFAGVDDRKMNYLASMHVISVLTCLHLYAGSVANLEDTQARGMALSIELYSERHQGALPKNWADIEDDFSSAPINQSLGTAGVREFQERYAFFAKPVPLPPNRGAEIIVIRTVPSKKSSGASPARYAVVRTKTGEISVTSFLEEEVHAIFNQAGVPLPKPKVGVEAAGLENVRNFPDSGASLHPSGATPPATAILNPGGPADDSASRRIVASRSAQDEATPHTPTLPWILAGAILALLIAIGLLIRRRT